jgi:hypothetical protein
MREKLRFASAAEMGWSMAGLKVVNITTYRVAGFGRQGG